MSFDPDDALPAYDDDYNPNILVRGQLLVSSLSDLLESIPELQSHPFSLAVAVNHLANEQMFKVIGDPKDFKQWYISRYEDPTNSLELSKYPIPPFDNIAIPLIDRNILTFFAVNSNNGFPYRVDLNLLTDLEKKPVYHPLV
eukprot:TRINITY_DN6292_c0_g1_i1.p1 TRINITY_DN6292_c0_g1~~TRINITY_DN6292_c0_g1_i1.p1  ORF type:complete len:142 (+),score=2.59 TRINITY_DN6292_c0_g1_i1:445-870(+)